ncbi:MAG: 2-oxo acid dehydrogenase subunit E2 [Desulfovibrio sp.]|jgi:pyruvate dehydrogenase E2 component (dihydrolipoamide acetyltransferase)|nr:2-oxo acid dehydrogenase subunit E2 [Desulfovibrio sp.]
MAEIIIMPKLGFNMDEGQLVKWHKKAGDAVVKGEVLFEINTDKTAMPVESTMDGIVLKILLQEGDFAPVFTPIAVIGQAGEDPDAILAQAGEASSAASEKGVLSPVSAPSSPATVAASLKNAELRLTPKARKLVRDEGIDQTSLAGIQGSGFRGGITAADIKASPLARKTAARDGIDLASVRGSGAGGKIMRTDLPAAPGHAPVPPPDAAEKAVASSIPYKGVRRIIGDRLAGSKFTAPHVYFSDSVDTTRLSALRARIKEAGDTASVSDLLILAAGRALRRYPDLNASLEGERIVVYRSVNIGLAVAGSNGLVVPVLKNVQGKSLSDIAGETRDLVERAKSGHLAPEEYSGGTFTISNLGPFGIENFTAIVNPPESAILAVSAVRKKAVVVGDEDGNEVIVARPIMNIQLSVDHRIVDGLLAANFVKYFKELLENPIRILL